jgi:PmbA protein
MSILDASVLKDAAQQALDAAKKLGATAAEVGISQSVGLSVNVRQAEIETLEHNKDTGLGVTVYLGQSKASASTSDLRPEAIHETVAMACSIAKHTQEDKYAGLADAALMATSFPDLQLYYPWELSPEQAIALAMECEQAGRDFDPLISNSEGASVSSHEGQRIYANSHGFIGQTQSSRHTVSCTLIARDELACSVITGMTWLATVGIWLQQCRLAVKPQSKP